MKLSELLIARQPMIMTIPGVHGIALQPGLYGHTLITLYLAYDPRPNADPARSLYALLDKDTEDDFTIRTIVGGQIQGVDYGRPKEERA